MRLFIAFRVPADTLLPLQEKITAEGVKLAHEFHCTLKFLSEVAEEHIPRIIGRLKTISFHPFSLHFSEIGAFPALQNIRVLWTGLQPEKPIIALQQQIEDVLETFFPKNEHFTTHVTLARLTHMEDEHSFKTIVHQLKIEPEEFVVSEFILFKSELQGDKHIYSVVERFSSS